VKNYLGFISKKKEIKLVCNVNVVAKIFEDKKQMEL
jgi:hypothetical protein